jgi:hypothetical protein
MSAAEVIEMIEKLPPTERATVRAYLATKEKTMPTPDEPTTIRYMSTAEADRISEQVFDQHKELFRRLAQ